MIKKKSAFNPVKPIYFIMKSFIIVLIFGAALAQASPCKKSGEEILLKESHDIGMRFQPTYQKINRKISQNIFHYKKNYCPSACEQKNDFRIKVSSFPKFTKKGSCKDTSEQYTFKKEFKSRQKSDHPIKDMDLASEDMSQWIKTTFVNPYLPSLLKKEVSHEHKSTLHSACPPCSFYLHYDYKFENNNLIKSDVLVKCGDLKITKLIGKNNFTARFKLINNWTCENKGSLPESILVNNPKLQKPNLSNRKSLQQANLPNRKLLLKKTNPLNEPLTFKQPNSLKKFHLPNHGPFFKKPNSQRQNSDQIIP